MAEKLNQIVYLKTCDHKKFYYVVCRHLERLGACLWSPGAICAVLQKWGSVYFSSSTI